MELYDLWFILIGVLFTGFFFLEGFDYGVGILLPFLGKDDLERRAIINTIGPVWDANEVWMITAGGAMFAAFPHWYATLFSGFYLALVLILLALIVRGVAFEFRSKHDDPRWRRAWDTAIFLGSLIPALLWGVAFGNIVNGVPIDASRNFTGNFLDLLSPYTLLCGAASLVIFMLHGAIFLSLKTEGDIRTRAEALAQQLWIPAVVVSAVLAVANIVHIDLFDEIGPALVSIASGAALLGVVYTLRQQRFGRAFALIGLTIVLSVAAFFWFMHPNVMVSSTADAYNITVEEAASSQTTLEVMTVVALIFVPFVLIYQGWTYWVFRQRIGSKSKLEY